MSDKIDSPDVNTESLLMHSDNHRQHLMYFCIYVHLDEAKMATLARMKVSSHVTKHNRSRHLNAERNSVLPC